MKVRMNQQVSGTRDGEKWPEAGEELTVSDAEGAGLCSSGLASPVTDRAEPETRPQKAEPETRQGTTTRNGPVKG